MKKCEMIKEHDEFTYIIKKGNRVGNKFLSLYYIDGRYNYPHFGIAVTKKMGDAVTRNLQKRRMRVILDEFKKDLRINRDYIIILKENAGKMNFEEMKQSFNSLVSRQEN